MGIEPTLAAWEAAVLPLNYTRAERSLCPPRGGWQRGGTHVAPRRQSAQKLLPKVTNTLVSLPPSCATVVLAPTLVSSPHTLVRAPSSTVP